MADSKEWELAIHRKVTLSDTQISKANQLLQTKGGLATDTAARVLETMVSHRFICTNLKVEDEAGFTEEMKDLRITARTPPFRYDLD